MRVRLEQQAADLRRANEQLQSELAERERSAAALATLNQELQASGSAALNLMDDAVEARNRLETANQALRSEVAERQRVEVALRASEHCWQTTFDAIGDGVSLLDANGHILKCNAALEKLLGKPSADIVGRRCFEVMHGTSAPIEGCPVVRARQTKRRETMELAISDRHFEVTVDPLLDQ